MIMQEGVVTNCVSDFKTGTKIEGSNTCFPNCRIGVIERACMPAKDAINFKRL